MENTDFSTQTFNKNYIKFFLNILATLFSTTLVSYIAYYIFLKVYLSSIGYDNLFYNSLIDINAKSSLSFGIFTIVFLFLFLLCILPMGLRYFYNDIIGSTREFNRSETRFIDGLFIITLSSPVVLFTYLEYGQTYNFLISILVYSVILFTLLFKIKTIFQREILVKTIMGGLLLTLTPIFALLPIFPLLKAVINSGIPTDYLYISLIAIWLLFSIIYGIRITNNHPVQYAIDLLLAIYILIQIFSFSSNTLNIPIANFTGIRDYETKIYKISQLDFQKIKPDIEGIWGSKAPNLKLDVKNNKDKLLIYFIYMDSVYLNTQVIFRNNNQAIICPASYGINRNTERCLLVNRSILKPISLNLQENFKKSKIKEPLKNSFNISDVSYENVILGW